LVTVNEHFMHMSYLCIPGLLCLGRLSEINIDSEDNVDGFLEVFAFIILTDSNVETVRRLYDLEQL
jgi:hypothetical protein